ncbi:MAG TPA: hypothetical protein VN886_00130 [Acidimicrobiales bacterium]|jgi:hypothetical protein|nr:hypothetical protein [Acidimicrobiales bacterium]
MQSIELHQEVGPYTCYHSIDLGGEGRSTSASGGLEETTPAWGSM